MSETQQTTEMLTRLNSGMLDEFGTGNVLNNKAENFSLPSTFASMAQDGWSVAQWGQPQAVDVHNYVVNNPATYDARYGDAPYSWHADGQTAAIALYQNESGGDVVQLTDGSTDTAPQGQTNEADMFLTAPPLPSNDTSLAHPVTLSLDAKVVQSITDFASTAAAVEYATDGRVFSVLDVGFYIRYDGADGLPAYGGFVQIVPWSSMTNTAPSYESQNVLPGSSSSSFVSSIRLGDGGALPSLSSDANALPDLLSYNINQYAYASILGNFSSFSSAQRASLYNLANWTVSAPYIGIATNNVPTSITSSGTVSSDVAHLSSSIQLSNISLKTSLNQTYTPTSAANTTSSITTDSNPQISYGDYSMNTSGKTDGGAYMGSLGNIQYEYLYTGYDSIKLTAPTDGNWYFGGGYGSTTLSCTSGDNVFLSSMAGSMMEGGTGNDTFIIQGANANFSSSNNIIENFHSGDKLILNGLGSYGWTYQWLYDGSNSSPGMTLMAKNPSNGFSERITLLGVSTSALQNMSTVKVNSKDQLEIAYASEPSSTASVVSSDNVAIAPITFPSERTRLSFIHNGNSTAGQTLQLSVPARLFSTASSEVDNFSMGDKLVLDNLTGVDWTYSLRSFSGLGAELLVENKVTGVSDTIIFGGTDLSSLAISWGAVASNHLVITHM